MTQLCIFGLRVRKPFFRNQPRREWPSFFMFLRNTSSQNAGDKTSRKKKSIKIYELEEKPKKMNKDNVYKTAIGF